MPVSFSKVAVIVFIAGFVCVLLLGAFLFGSDILNPKLAGFRFVCSGVVSSALAGAWVAGSKRSMGNIAAISLFVFFAISRPDSGILILRGLAYIMTLVASVVLAWTVSTKLPFAVLVRVATWAIAFAVCHGLTFFVLVGVNGERFSQQDAYSVTLAGGLIGLGVGVGVHLALGLVRLAIGSADSESDG